MDPLTGKMEALLRHERFVRELARSIVRGDAAAQDLTQDAWLAAMRNPPKSHESERGWLATVVRRLASNARRQLKRAIERDRRHARDESVPSRTSLLEREETRKRLLAAVLDLDEPFGTTLLLRYFEGMTPPQIARRTNTPLDTVKSRLKRGLARLRETLDATVDGGRSAWMAAFVPLAGLDPAVVGLAGSSAGGAVAAGHALGVPSAVLGGVVVGTKTKLAVLAVTLVTSSLLFLQARAWMVDRRAHGGVATAAESTSGSTSRRGDASHAGAASSAQSDPLGAPARSGDAPSGDGAVAAILPVPYQEPRPTSVPTTGSLGIAVRWASDLSPASGITVVVTSADVPTGIRLVTGTDGTLDVPDLAPGEYEAMVDRCSESFLHASAKVVAGVRSALEMIIPNGIDLEGIVVDGRGDPVTGADVFLTLGYRALEATPAAVTRGDGTFLLRSVNLSNLVYARSERFALCDGVQIPRGTERPKVRIVLQEEGGTIEGRVLGPDSEPIAGASVLIGGEGIGVETRPDGTRGLARPPIAAQSDRMGRFRATGVPSRRVPVIVTVRRLAPWSEPVQVRPGQVVTVEARLRVGAVVDGVVLDSQRKPLPGVSVWLTAADAMPARNATSDAHGAFRVESLPDGEITVGARAKTREQGSAKVTADSSRQSHVEIVLKSGQRVSGRVVDQLDRGLAGWKVSVTSLVDLDGVTIAVVEESAVTDAQGSFVVENCREGVHEVVTEAPETETVTGKATQRTAPDGVGEVVLRVVTTPR